MATELTPTLIAAELPSSLSDLSSSDDEQGAPRAALRDDVPVAAHPARGLSSAIDVAAGALPSSSAARAAPAPAPAPAPVLALVVAAPVPAPVHVAGATHLYATNRGFWGAGTLSEPTSSKKYKGPARVYFRFARCDEIRFVLYSRCIEYDRALDQKRHGRGRTSKPWKERVRGRRP